MPAEIFADGDQDYIEKFNTVAQQAFDGDAAAGRLDDHIDGTADKHGASAIVNTPAGGIAATDVQAAINELDGDKQDANANLTALAGQTGAADKVSYWTAAATLALTTLGSFGRTMIAWADAAAARTGLGLGTLATQNGTFSGTSSGTNTGDQTSVTGSAGSLSGATFAAPGTIGGGTPGAATFTTLTATGQVSLGGAAGAEALRALVTASAVNRFELAGSTTGAYIGLAAQGSDTNIGIAYQTKGTGGHDFYTRGNRQVVIANAANAVNSIALYGAATGSTPLILTVGGDANVSLNLSSAGTGAVNLYTGSTARLGFQVSDVASAVNFVGVSGAATGGNVVVQALGTNTNVPLGLYGKGTGAVFTVVRGAVGLYVDNPASAVNYAYISGAATGSPVSFTAAGSDTNRSITFITAGTGTARFSNKIYPGTPAAATQTAAGLSAGTGAPSNSDASDGDFYFRSDGGALTSIYQKRAGAWVGIV